MDDILIIILSVFGLKFLTNSFIVFDLSGLIVERVRNIRCRMNVAVSVRGNYAVARVGNSRRSSWGNTG